MRRLIIASVAILSLSDIANADFQLNNPYSQQRSIQDYQMQQNNSAAYNQQENLRYQQQMLEQQEQTNRAAQESLEQQQRQTQMLEQQQMNDNYNRYKIPMVH